MILTSPRPCSLHRYHSPRPAYSQLHHIWPLGLGGPEKASNRIPVCGTGHNNIHQLLNFYVDFKGTPPWPIRREFGPGEREIAAEGWRRFVMSTSSETEPTHDVEETQ